MNIRVRLFPALGYKTRFFREVICSKLKHKNLDVHANYLHLQESHTFLLYPVDNWKPKQIIRLTIWQEMALMLVSSAVSRLVEIVIPEAWLEKFGVQRTS